ncbi:hypothetical protein G7046_g8955 [Stylonectria norvegica]|nr:hypothetical protein G7046_g8955 [Stylonectria norvegica]
MYSTIPLADGRLVEYTHDVVGDGSIWVGFDFSWAFPPYPPYDAASTTTAPCKKRKNDDGDGDDDDDEKKAEQAKRFKSFGVPAPSILNPAFPSTILGGAVESLRTDLSLHSEPIGPLLIHGDFSRQLERSTSGMENPSVNMSEQPNGDDSSEIPKPAEVIVKKEEKAQFSWLQPHPIFVIILVGKDEHPFGIQKDYLCDRSESYQTYFAENSEEKVEHIVRLPSTTKEIFGLAQNFMYTKEVISDVTNVPSYESLVGLWKLGHKLGIRGLCDKTLEAMIDCRRLTERIPATPLLIQVWRDTPEGSSIRTLLLSWAAEYMRSSDARAEFAKSLPQEVLSELVVAMSSFDTVPVVHLPAADPSTTTLTTPRKNVHYLEDDSGDEVRKNTKQNRRSSVFLGTPLTATDQKALLGRKPSRASLPKPPPQKRRSSAAQVDVRTFTTAQKLDFCADLLNRMLSGPGFWTRLVGPFREPVEPADDGVPDYLDKVKRPMDLSTIKAKMDRKGYTDDEEFLADVRQIFNNCFTYWKNTDPMYNAGEKLQKTFEEKYSHMNKWIAKMGGEEGE